jgi:hypothetical protein
MYSERDLDLSRRRTEEARAVRGEVGRIGRTGRLGMSVDRVAYFNAINVNGGVRPDGKTVWDDPEFVRDMKRRHPEIDVNPDQGPVRRGMVSRFGRVKERTTYYPDGRKVTVRA